MKTGGLAQLARALDLHSRGQGFDSLILHESASKIEKEQKKRSKSIGTKDKTGCLQEMRFESLIIYISGKFTFQSFKVLWHVGKKF